MAASGSAGERRGEQGRGSSAFRIFLRGLPDEIARLEEQTGEPFVVVLPAEPPAHLRRLLVSLGAKWRVE